MWNQSKDRETELHGDPETEIMTVWKGYVVSEELMRGKILFLESSKEGINTWFIFKR